MDGTDSKPLDADQTWKLSKPLDVNHTWTEGVDKTYLLALNLLGYKYLLSFTIRSPYSSHLSSISDLTNPRKAAKDARVRQTRIGW